MANQNKLLIMAQMAVYDKRYGAADRAALSYFMRDYIYRKNTWTRLSVGFGALLLLGVYWLHQVFWAGVDVQQINAAQSIWDSALFLVAVLAFYTLVGTMQSMRAYGHAEKRMERYQALLQRLERLEEAED